jgi:hypothetical protein
MMGKFLLAVSICVFIALFIYTAKKEDKEE